MNSRLEQSIAAILFNKLRPLLDLRAELDLRLTNGFS